ncbi:hypothetical protein KPL74_04560 [Bacillus sp. NP157]|nr:hypothetical protein KPL74_04560 [Bacillus sp. NP157]
MSVDSLLPRKVAFNLLCFQAAFWISLGVSAWMWRFLPDGTIRTCLVLIPVLLGLLIAANAFWVYEACDEFIRLRILKCVVVTAMVVAACSLGYFFLELLGFPRLSMLVVNLFGWSVFNLSLLYVVSRSR